MKSIRVAVAAAAAGVSFLGLAACSTPVEAGAAAIVGDQRISSSDLNANVKSYQAALERANIGPDQLTAPVAQFVLFSMTNQLRYQQLADKHGVTVSETEIDTALKDPGQFQDPEMNLLSKGVSPADARDYVKAEVGIRKVMDKFGGAGNQQAAAKVQQEFNSIKTVFSPRYGTLQQGQGFVDPGRFGKPAQTAQQPQG
ncbi:SurA N-terminal domain-containing protein [Nonomuraea harbinensis]|uniref:SurA N-terminal domain-containing protein n=1 Tax=Nonomuraea harbinensis TaxID=1286938 RepID=A0ABW1BWS2_9ACTN|nr:SurA N-terminal domain-containing protein [Nonomuraea harbinensis]